MTALALIRTQALDFRTDQLTDWLDGLPLIARPGEAAVVAGPSNVGSASVSVAVDASAQEGVHLVTVTGLVSGLPVFSVSDPDGTLTGIGVLGETFYASGLTVTPAAIAGQPAPSVGDTFAVSILPVPVDLTGLVFDLAALQTARSATVMLSAGSAPPSGATPTILSGGVAGTLAMRVLRQAMARCPVGDYPYTLLASDPRSGLNTTVFTGTIRHRALPSLQD